MWRYSACLSFPPRCSDRTSLVYMNTLSSSPLSASTVFVSPHPCSPVFIFYFPFYVLAGLHASVLLSPPIPISALSPPSLQLSLSFLSACPPICWSCPDNSAEGRSSPPPFAPSLSPDVPPLRCLSIRLFFPLSPDCLPHPVFLSFNLTPLLSSISLHLPHKAIHSSCIYPSGQLLVPGSSQPSPDPTAAGSKCRGDRAWAKISSPRRSLSMYQLIGINLHPRIPFLLLCFFLSVTGPLCCFIFPLTENPRHFFFFWGNAKKSLRRTPSTPFYSSYNIWMVCFLCHILFSIHHRVLCKDARNMSDLSLILHMRADKNSLETSKEPRRLDVISRLAAVLLASATQCNLALMVSYICFSKMNMFLWFIIHIHR